MSWDACPSCPLCAWSTRCYRPAERPGRLADHIAEHSMFEVVVALIRRTFEKPLPCPKVGYPDEQTAAAGLLAAWRSPSPRRREIRYYDCPRCGYWHLTSKPLKEKTS